jgi:hypothetical protein
MANAHGKNTQFNRPPSTASALASELFDQKSITARRKASTFG